MRRMDGEEGVSSSVRRRGVARVGRMSRMRRRLRGCRNIIITKGRIKNLQRNMPHYVVSPHPQKRYRK